MRKLYEVQIERTVKQKLTVHRSGYDSEEVIEAAMDEANDDSPYLGWQTEAVKEIELIGIEVIHLDLERDE